MSRSHHGPDGDPRELIDLTTAPLSQSSSSDAKLQMPPPLPSVLPLDPASALPPRRTVVPEVRDWKAMTIVTGSGLSRRVLHHVTDPDGNETTYESMHDVPLPARQILTRDDNQALWLEKAPRGVHGERPRRNWREIVPALLMALVVIAVVLFGLYDMYAEALRGRI